jgi:hypothetical protein
MHGVREEGMDCETNTIMFITLTGVYSVHRWRAMLYITLGCEA